MLMWEFLLRILQTLWKTIILWWPLKLVPVPAGSSALVLRFGTPHRVLDAGLAVATSGEEIKVAHCRRRVLQTETIPIITADGVGLRVDVECLCTVANVKTFFLGSENPDWLAAYCVLSYTRRELQSATLHEIITDMDRLLIAVVNEASETMFDDAGLHILQLGVRSLSFENPMVAATAASGGLYHQLPDELREYPELAAAMLSSSAMFTKPIVTEGILDESPAQDPDCAEG